MGYPSRLAVVALSSCLAVGGLCPVGALLGTGGTALAQEGGPARIVLTPEAAAQLSAADQARADALKGEANTLFVGGRYKESIVKFEQAYEISKELDLLYSVAVSYQNLEKWQECVTYMERYLERAEVGPKKDRAENTRLSCEARIERDQQLIVSTNPPGARIYIDDRAKGVVGQTAAGKTFTTYLRPGQHTVWIELEGHEPVEQVIEVQRKEPFQMSVVLTKVKNLGWVYVDASIRDARVYIAGKTVGLTPFEKPLPSAAGPLQVVVERDGYTRFSKEVTVVKGQVTTVDAYLVKVDTSSTWRSPLGWTMNVIGILAVGGGVASMVHANNLYNDTDDFETFSGLETIGYGVGGGLLAVGTALLIWDQFRDVIPPEDRNPGYGKPAGIPDDDGNTVPLSLAPGHGPRSRHAAGASGGVIDPRVAPGPGGLSFGFRF